MRFILGVAFLLAVTFFGSTDHALAYGGVGSGGGNTVGTKLFDDFENDGTEKIPIEEIKRLVKPRLEDLAKRLPSFAMKLEEGIKGLIWYKESKPLAQDGPCKDGAGSGISLHIDQVVRACQSKVNIRIDKTWYDSKPSILPDLIVHELLVYQRLHQSEKGAITEESMLEVSREIRNENSQSRLSDVQLQDLVVRSGFGKYSTKKQYDKFMSARKHALKLEHQRGYCLQGMNFVFDNISAAEYNTLMADDLPSDLKVLAVKLPNERICGLLDSN